MCVCGFLVYDDKLRLNFVFEMLLPPMKQ